jgi:hypothetical protein
MSNSITPEKNKFAFIHGSFSFTAPYLRTVDSDIDVFSQNMDTCEIRSLLQKKYPLLQKNIKIDNIRVKSNENNDIEFNSCYWQNIIPVELFNKQKINYNLVRSDLFSNSFSCYLRNPDKQAVLTLLNDPNAYINLKHMSTTVINRHYSYNEYCNAIKILNSEEQIIMKELPKLNYELKNECKSLFNKTLYLNRTSGTIDGDNIQMPYHNFIYKCLLKN